MYSALLGADVSTDFSPGLQVSDSLVSTVDRRRKLMGTLRQPDGRQPADSMDIQVSMTHHLVPKALHDYTLQASTIQGTIDMMLAVFFEVAI